MPSYEDLRREVSNAFAAGKLSAEEAKELFARLEEEKLQRSTAQLKQEEVITTAIPESKANTTEIIIADNDLSHFKEGALIPRHIYENNLEEFSAKAMYSTFFILCKHVNQEGIVAGLTTTAMAEFYNYSDSRNLRNSLAKLEELEIISVNRSTNPHIYKINDYCFVKGGFMVPTTLMKDVKVMKLKQLRLEWYYMCRNLHSPRNQSKMDLSLGLLKKKIKAVSLQEVRDLTKSLTDKFFTTVKEIPSTYLQSWNKLKVSFNKQSLGIIENLQDNLQDILQHHLYADLKYIFKTLTIKTTSFNYRQAFKLISNYTERELMIVKQNCQQGRIAKSTTGSVAYLKKWLELARQGAIIPQY